MNDKTNTQATDYVRICFHSVTEFELPVGGCGTCWEEVILMLCEMASPAEILAAPHECLAAWNCSRILADELSAHPEKW
ncbi:UNVERIFIED_ORG: hypothetical protein ABIB13_003210 [Arthrobacter sp. UYEF2]